MKTTALWIEFPCSLAEGKFLYISLYSSCPFKHDFFFFNFCAPRQINLLPAPQCSVLSVADEGSLHNSVSVSPALCASLSFLVQKIFIQHLFFMMNCYVDTCRVSVFVEEVSSSTHPYL